MKSKKIFIIALIVLACTITSLVVFNLSRKKEVEDNTYYNDATTYVYTDDTEDTEPYLQLTSRDGIDIRYHCSQEHIELALNYLNETYHGENGEIFMIDITEGNENPDELYVFYKTDKGYMHSELIPLT